MSRYQPSDAINRMTRYLVRERKDGTRCFRLTSIPVPFVGRRRRARKRPHVLAQVAWLSLPGLLLPLISLANSHKIQHIDLIDTWFFFAALVLAVRAWVAPTHWAVRAFGVLASLSFPLMRVVLG